MMLSIIIVNWHSKELLRSCLNSIISETHNLKFEIVVVDAGSFDGCGPMLSAEFPQARFLQLQENVGFAKANNIAFSHARGKYLLFLNPDTQLIGSAINSLLAVAQRLPDAGAIGGRLLNTDGTLQTSCVQAQPTILNQLLSCEYLRTRWPKARLWGMAALHSPSQDPQEVEAISGACVMSTRTAFEQVGGFSEDYFMYAEDIDLSHKYRLAGFRNYYVSAATVLHHGGSSSAQAPSRFSVVMARESMWRFLLKSRGNAYAMAYRISVTTAAICRLFAGLAYMLFHWSSRAQHIGAMHKWSAILAWSLGSRRSLR